MAECNTLPLHLRQGHVFVELGGELWLLDSGSPKSFGTSSCVAMAGEHPPIRRRSYLNLTAATLSQLVGVPCVGLLGADVLCRFDHIFDTGRGRLTVSTAELSHNGQRVPLGGSDGIPILRVRVGSSDYQMYFDTGAQFSYFQDDSLTKFPSAGSVTDFYPGWFDHFQTETHEVPVSLDGVAITLRCGRLPDLLGMTLMRAGVKGTVGNEILANRVVGYFPRRQMMVLRASNERIAMRLRITDPVFRPRRKNRYCDS
jgi:hypothetical protein